MAQIQRFLTEKVLNNLSVSPAVFLNGPRQAGKSTLVQSLSGQDYPAEYLSFDNATEMAAAANNPMSYLTMKPKPLIIDEVQLVPELFRDLKIVIDESRLQSEQNPNGQYLLTGSANIMALPKLSDALVGRMSVLTLYPLSVSEVLGTKSHFIENLFNEQMPSKIKNAMAIEDAISQATFPEISGQKSPQQQIWFENYLSTLLQRDVRSLFELEKIHLLPNLLRILAAQTGNLVNEANIARALGTNAMTERNYRSVLKMMFLTHDMKPWFRNLKKRLVKAPKSYFLDTLLLCHLLGYEHHELASKRPDLYGQVLENFVASELLKLVSFSDQRESLMMFRTAEGKEVDFVLERPNGDLVGIEVKAADRVSASDFKGLRELKSLAGDDFKCGVVIHRGKSVIPFEDKLWAIPFDMLWQ